MDIGDKVQRVVIGIITAVILLLVGFALGPTVLDATTSLTASNLTGVPMGEVILLLSTYIGFFYYLGIILGAMTMIWAVANYS
jgi:hypothetical protein